MDGRGLPRTVKASHVIFMQNGFCRNPKNAHGFCRNPALPLGGFFNAEAGGWSAAYAGDGEAAFGAFCTAAAVGALEGESGGEPGVVAYC